MKPKFKCIEVNCKHKIWHKGHRCHSCAEKHYWEFHPEKKRQDKFCKICKRPISKRNKSGNCNSCAQKLIWDKNPHRFDGRNNPFFEKKHSKKYINWLKNRTGKNNPNFKKGNRARLYTNCIECGNEVTQSCRSGLCGSCSMEKRWDNKEYRKKVLLSLEPHYEKMIKNLLKKCHNRPNNLEKILIELIKKLNLSYKYVGNAKFWIGRFNPDFIDLKNKKIIEVFGSYWHNREDYKIRDKKKLNLYKKYGYKTLVIWDYDLKNINLVTNKLLSFTKKGNK